MRPRVALSGIVAATVMALAAPAMWAQEGTTRPSAVTLDDVRAALEAREHRLQGIHQRMSLVGFWSASPDGAVPEAPDEWILEQEYEVFRHGSRLKIERATLDRPEPGGEARTRMRDEFTWDGKMTRFLAHRDVAKHPQRGAVIAEKGAPYVGTYYLTLTEDRVFDIDQPLAKLLHDGRWRVAGADSVGEFADCVVVETAEPLLGEVHMRLWLDPLRDFAPVQIEQRVEAQGVLPMTAKLVDVVLRSTDAGHVVAGGRIVLHNPNVPQEPGRGEWCIYAVGMEQVEAGLNLPDDVFRLAFPKGTWVMDRIAGVEYVVGDPTFDADADDPESYSHRRLDEALASLDQPSSEAQALPPRPGAEPVEPVASEVVPPDSASPSIRVVALLVALAGALLLVWWGWRYRTRTRPVLSGHK